MEKQFCGGQRLVRADAASDLAPKDWRQRYQASAAHVRGTFGREFRQRGVRGTEYSRSRGKVPCMCDAKNVLRISQRYSHGQTTLCLRHLRVFYGRTSIP